MPAHTLDAAPIARFPATDDGGALLAEVAGWQHLTAQAPRMTRYETASCIVGALALIAAVVFTHWP